MGQKINPILFRTGGVKPWKSKWFAKDFKFAQKLEEDHVIRSLIQETIAHAGIDSIVIEKAANNVTVTICVEKPGIVIGRGGKGVEELIGKIQSQLDRLRAKRGIEEKAVLRVTIEEVKRYEVSAQVTAQHIAWDLEKRLPYRRTIKKYLQRVMQNKNVKGAKIRVAGRLNGAEIARAEQLSEGSLPLHTLRADIDYGFATAYTTYGTIGVKVWIYRGEKFVHSESKNKKS